MVEQEAADSLDTLDTIPLGARIRAHSLENLPFCLTSVPAILCRAHLLPTLVRRE